MLNNTLIKTRHRNVAMGGIKSIFYGDVAQLLPVNPKEEPICKSGLFRYSRKYCLMEPVTQTEAGFIEILNKVRLCQFDESVIKYINSRAVLKSDIPNKSLRLYTTRQRVTAANSKDSDAMS
ncbi:hypothetical protein A0J61_11333 [Choanephora cucurbitarum]|uniref:ATP-dependent DNA helicase n=1 Tax=Choanephora cucurbitarum TaxID=101091 RepID=A0A1C7MW13_9FUNG|nr:hypothetical protein A0J61_11333 [Choanephora cucurbitarum]